MNEGSAAKSVIARFSAAAQTYDHLSDVQRTVAHRLMTDSMGLTNAGTHARILEIGCGTGTLTELLLGRFPGAEIHAVDVAGAMIDVARKRLDGRSPVRWHVADARCFRHEENFSLIVSSSALQWMTPVADTIKRLEGLLEPGGIMASALMVDGTFEELHAAREQAAPEKFRRISLPSVRDVLDAHAEAGLRASVREEFLRTRCDSARSLLRSLNRLGVTGTTNRGGAVLNRTELHRLMEYYDDRFACASGGVFATYRVLYVTARKKD